MDCDVTRTLSGLAALAVLWLTPIEVSAQTVLFSENEAVEDQADVADALSAGADGLPVEVIRERYPNSAVKIEREVTQDTQGNYINHGSWKMWDERGTPIAQGQFHLGDRDGLWTRWYRSRDARIFSEPPFKSYAGPFVSQATFSTGQLDGEWAIYDSKQRKISSINFDDGERHGPAVWWHSNGQKKFEAVYAAGVIDGELNEWQPDGAVVRTETYQDGHKLASKTAHHDAARGRSRRSKAANQAAKKSEGMYLFARLMTKTPDDWWNAVFATYEPQGDDLRHGPWVEWFDNGRKRVEGAYKHDAPVGTFTWWYTNGQKALEGGYEDGKQEGSWTWWHENGQKATDGRFLAGHPTGKWGWWLENGKVAQSADFTEAARAASDLPASEYEALLPSLPSVPR